MSHSGNQGPYWWFSIFGKTGSRSGIARAVIVIASILIIAGVGVLLLR